MSLAVFLLALAVLTQPQVETRAGVLAGTHFGSLPNEVAFLGVPFAAPPIGALRWRPPQPARPWPGTREATTFGAACPQLPASWLPTVAWNEDCLYLNVWTAQWPASAKRPVMVYFHGGSNTAGYSQMTPLGPELSRLGVVVVSANYRLGPMGFFAHPALTAESEHHASGNYGLLDQLQALAWVQENIARFGGDPERVTVMGQSAGAVDICLLMASPLAGGLFQRAILQSGDCQGVLNQDIRTPQHYNGIAGTGEGAGERFASDLGVGQGLDALRALSAADILAAWKKDRGARFGAIVDGWVVPEQPAKIFAEGRQAHVPVLVGSNADEATVFGHGPATLADYKAYLFADSGGYAPDEERLYPAASDAEVAASYLRLQNEAFAYGAYTLARAMTRIGQHAYLYVFSFAETGRRAPLGAYHGEELNFLANAFPQDWEHHQDEENLAVAMRTYWTQFAKTGDANAPGLPTWPEFDPRAERYLDFGRTRVERPVAARLHAIDQIMSHIVGEACASPRDMRSRPRFGCTGSR